MEDIGIFYGHLVYFVAIWYILCLFGINFPVLVFCTKKNLATLYMKANVACIMPEVHSNYRFFSCKGKLPPLHMYCQ
jgi:hypothetical protein